MQSDYFFHQTEHVSPRLTFYFPSAPRTSLWKSVSAGPRKRRTDSRNRPIVTGIYRNQTPVIIDACEYL